MNREENKKQSSPLTHGDALALPQPEKKTKLKKADRELVSRSDARVSGGFCDNQIFDLLTVEELAVIFGLAPQTIRNWVARGKLPHVKIGRRNLFLMRSIKRWLNRKEEPLWE